MKMVYKGPGIKRHAYGYSWKIGRPIEVNLNKMSAVQRAKLEADDEIVESKPGDPPPKTDLEIANTHPDYEPPAGNTTPVRRKRASKVRRSR